MRKLKRLIKKHWGVKYKTIDKNLTLLQLSEQIVMDSENCTLEEAYNMYLDNPSIHLPGLVALYIVDEMGIDAKNVNVGMTLERLFNL